MEVLTSPRRNCLISRLIVLLTTSFAFSLAPASVASADGHAERDYRWLVGFYLPDEESPFCSGVLVFSNRVVTAAHCVSSIDEEFSRIRVKTYTGKTTSAVAKATTHPRYALLRDDGPRRAHVVADIAVVSLTKPIRLPQYPVFPSAKTRGATYLYGMSEHRTFEELPVRQATTKAKNWFNHVDSGHHIAAVSHNGTASCAGDSGGGLVA